MVSHGHQAPPPEDAVPRCPLPARAAVASLGHRGAAEAGDLEWIAEAAASGTQGLRRRRLGRDRPLGPRRPRRAAALRRLPAQRRGGHALHPHRRARARPPARWPNSCPLAVVTLGAEGACAVDSATGETAEVPSLVVEALDPTGAGDVFVAGFVTGTLAGWPLTDRLAFASLCAALSVQEFGGSLSAPGWIEIAGWWEQAKAYAGQAPGRPRGGLPLRLPRGRCFPPPPAPGRCAAPSPPSASARPERGPPPGGGIAGPGPGGVLRARARNPCPGRHDGRPLRRLRTDRRGGGATRGGPPTGTEGGSSPPVRGPGPPGAGSRVQIPSAAARARRTLGTPGPSGPDDEQKAG